MSTLNVLKLVAAHKPTSLPAVQQRRNKLVKRILEQIELAKAEQTGATFAPVKLRSYKDKDTGLRKQVETNKRVKPWWFTTDNGKLALNVRFGPKVLELAKAEQSGTTFAPVKLRSYTDKDTGVRKQVETNKRVKPWWFTADNGKLALSVRFGPKVLELAKGKYAVEVADKSEIVNVLEVVRTAVENGELDAAIDNAAKKLRDGFAK